MTRAEMNEHIVGLLLNAFPDETIQIGQRFRRHQVEVLNLAIVRAKYERRPLLPPGPPDGPGIPPQPFG